MKDNKGYEPKDYKTSISNTLNTEEVNEIKWEDFTITEEKGVPFKIDKFEDFTGVLLGNLKEAEEEAILNGINANTIILNEKYAYVKEFYWSIKVNDFWSESAQCPPILLGKELLLAPLPDGYQFALVESKRQRRNFEQELNLITKYIKILGQGENQQLVFKGISSKKHKEDFETIRRILGVYDDD